MKYLAILKDSLREALDSKVLYVLLGLSLLMHLFLATISYRPLPAERTLKEIASGTMALMRDHFNEGEEGERKAPRKKRTLETLGIYRFENSSVIRGAPDSPDADYRMTVSKPFARAEELEEAQQRAAEEIAQLRKHFAYLEGHGFYRIGDVKLLDDQQAETRKLLFQVELLSTSGTRRLWFHEITILFAFPLTTLHAPLGVQLFVISRTVLWFGSWIAVLLGVIITSFFIPNMLQKGAIDLLLVKPLRRSLLLCFKYIGGLTFVLLANAFAIFGIWLVLGLRSGLWANWMLLLLVPLLTYFFAVLYSVSTLVAVLTRSTVTAILVTIGVWFFLFVVGATNQFFKAKAHEEEMLQVPEEKRVFTGNAFGTVVGGIQRALPRTSDLDELSALIVFSDFMTGGYLAPEEVLTGDRNWWESFGVSTAFLVILLGLACWRFARKDY